MHNFLFIITVAFTSSFLCAGGLDHIKFPDGVHIPKKAFKKHKYKKPSSAAKLNYYPPVRIDASLKKDDLTSQERYAKYVDSRNNPNKSKVGIKKGLEKLGFSLVSIKSDIKKQDKIFKIDSSDKGQYYVVVHTYKTGNSMLHILDKENNWLPITNYSDILKVFESNI